MNNRRHSKKRDNILNVLKQRHTALSVAELHKSLPEMDITTIYRNLELFIKDGVIKKLNLSGDEAVYEYTEKAHFHAVCTDCDKVLHFTAPEKEIEKLLNLKDFETESIEITIRGKCLH